MIVTDLPTLLMVRLYIMSGPVDESRDAREVFINEHRNSILNSIQKWIDLYDFCLENGEFSYGWTDNFLPSRTINVGFSDPVTITKYKLQFG